MTSTSFTLLDAISKARDAATWGKFVDIYAPFIYAWLRKLGLQHQDAEDVGQEVLLVVLREMPQFRYDPNRGSFRNWLRRVASNRAKNFLRSRYGKATAVGGSESERRLAELSEGDSLAARQWDREHDQFVLGKLLDKVRAKFDAKTWEAFWRTAKLGEKPAAVAALLQISENAVYLAKSRVLQRLRKEAEEATGLLD